MERIQGDHMRTARQLFTLCCWSTHYVSPLSCVFLTMQRKYTNTNPPSPPWMGRLIFTCPASPARWYISPKFLPTFISAEFPLNMKASVTEWEFSIEMKSAASHACSPINLTQGGRRCHLNPSLKSVNGSAWDDDLTVVMICLLSIS